MSSAIFTPAVYHQFKLGVPAVGSYIEVFNSDAAAFGGSGQCNHQPIIVEEAPFHNQPYHIKLTIPPLGIIILMKETKKRKIMTAYEQV
ncbi:1,4-alpha-glucan (glycogen) branching enzyme, GH-13-type [Sporolactobacillus inulinus]|uniref:1,4-alpha-glucan (Glycogen) branching enzyme, GH-13-type n=1 Tax=Sporolactobacillus inulinus TaxID=2078 RepID=A0A4Y1ZAL2_9BACL|nr:1,4-alpha-glucan (glycogen) branching enzyme, GH-13-type [Sporolactobacillus inulinus]